MRSPRPRALARVSTVSPVRSTGRGVTKSGRSLLASRISSPTSRDIRSTSSSSSSRVSAISVGVADVEQLEVAAEHGERGLELVAGVVEELPLADERRLEPVEHPVEGPGQRGDVVVAGLGQPPGQVGVVDLVGGLAQRPQRREQPPGLRGRERGDHQQREQRDHDVGLDGVAAARPGRRRSRSPRSARRSRRRAATVWALRISSSCRVVDPGGAVVGRDAGGGRPRRPPGPRRCSRPAETCLRRAVVPGRPGPRRRRAPATAGTRRAARRRWRSDGAVAAAWNLPNSLELLVDPVARCPGRCAGLDDVDDQPGAGQGEQGEQGDRRGDPDAYRNARPLAVGRCCGRSGSAVAATVVTAVVAAAAAVAAASPSRRRRSRREPEPPEPEPPPEPDAGAGVPPWSSPELPAAVTWPSSRRGRRRRRGRRGRRRRGRRASSPSSSPWSSSPWSSPPWSSPLVVASALVAGSSRSGSRWASRGVDDGLRRRRTALLVDDDRVPRGGSSAADATRLPATKAPSGSIRARATKIFQKLRMTPRSCLIVGLRVRAR